MAVSSLEERQRKGRNVMLASLVLLVFIWTIRIAFPSALTINLDRFTPSTTNSKSNSPQEGNTKSVELAENAEHSSVHKASTSMADGFTSFDASFNGTLGSKVAVIVSSQFRTPVIPLVLRFSSVLGGGWPVIIYTSAESASSFATSAALSRYLATGLIQIRTLPQTTLLNNRADYTDFMVSSYLWEDLAPAENILLFHSDSILCANAARSVDDYFEYDFVGFPPAVLDENYTGGLSLRKRSTMLRVLEPYEEVQGETATPKWTDDKKFHFEDQWFYARMKTLQEEEENDGIAPEEDGAINLPSDMISKTFSVADIDYPHPLGVHMVHSWQKDRLKVLDEWCPEYKLCSTAPRLENGEARWG